MLLVFLSTRAGHEDIVNIGVCKGEPTKNLVDKALQHLLSVVKTTYHFFNSKSPRGLLSLSLRYRLAHQESGGIF